MKNRTKTLVVGGAFNPPTAAHIEIAFEAAKQIFADDIVYVPVGDKYDKSTLIEAEHRINMLQIAIEDFEQKYSINLDSPIKMYISRLEADYYRNLSTIETLDMLEKEYNTDIYFFCGSDNLISIPYWDNADDLLKHHKIVVAERHGYDIGKIINKNDLLKNAYNNKHIIIIDINRIEGYLSRISSTYARGALRRGEGFELIGEDSFSKRVMSYNVYRYIIDNDLYME